jgi:predicted RNA binding protein YcfA (HicA-like mRNA interferase family)
MSQIEKLIVKLKESPKDFKYSQLCKVMQYLGYIEDAGGRTTGSAVNFIDDDNNSITIHKPHPGDELHSPTVKRVVKYLIERGKI